MFFEVIQLSQSDACLVPTSSAVGLVTYFSEGKTQHINLLPLLHSGIYACLTVNWRLSHQGSHIIHRTNP